MCQKIVRNIYEDLYKLILSIYCKCKFKIFDAYKMPAFLFNFQSREGSSLTFP